MFLDDIPRVSASGHAHFAPKQHSLPGEPGRLCGMNSCPCTLIEPNVPIEQDANGYYLPTSERTLCDAAFACASCAVPVCCRI